MRIHPLQQLGATGLIDFAQHLCRFFRVVDEIEDSPLFAFVKVFEEVSDVSGMSLVDDPFQVSRGLSSDKPPSCFQ